jgi:hypothetical protein
LVASDVACLRAGAAFFARAAEAAGARVAVGGLEAYGAAEDDFDKLFDARIPLQQLAYLVRVDWFGEVMIEACRERARFVGFLTPSGNRNEGDCPP